MTLLTKAYSQNQEVLKRDTSSSKKKGQDPLSIRIKSTHAQESAMPEELKRQVQKNAPSLYELFDQTLRRKGEAESVTSHFVEENVLEVEGLSNLTLHSYVLEAEKLGKKVEYIKTLTVKISD
ncbi:hypothetical protein [Reichenbachiella sp.]|uniref:hypothetical protein n=1 Tax=Reichenbachiella sp. TaxID=2184521 RepID=UPI003BAF3BBF